MGGFFLDILFVYFFKTLQRIWRLRGSGAWSVAKATVRSVIKDVGYPTVDVMYTYKADGETYANSEEGAFMFRDSAEEYQKRIVVGSEITIRINPEDSGQSVMRDDDQIQTSANAR